MVEETFVAPTPQDAYLLAKEKYGEFGVLRLLRARQIKNADGELISEITVEVDEESFLESAGVSEEEELLEEIVSLRSRMQRLKSVMSPATGVSERVSRLFLERGIRSEWIEKILQEVKETSIASDEKLLISYMLETMDEEIEIVKERIGKREIRMLVGPTGVGKTTTIAKLAARYAYGGKKSSKVALVNLDTFRAGAYEQLENFASLLRLEHRYVRSIGDFERTLESLDTYDKILIDSAGTSPYDTGRLIKTIEFIKSVRREDMKISLVIPATAKYHDILDIYEHFSFINPSDIIVTKFDETRRIGDLIAFLTEKRVPVSYMSTGQQIPDDLEPASRERILELFVGELNV